MQVEKRFIIRAAGGQFVGIDSNSGYFFYTGFWNCEKFSNLESAKDFAGHNWGSLKSIEWEIYSCDEIGTKFVQAEPDSYEIELAALKKKHNRD